MAQTYTPIQRITVGSSGSASIQFTNIPQNYTDLKIVLSGRDNRSLVVDGCIIRFNQDTSSGNYSARRLYGDGSAIVTDTTYALLFVAATNSTNNSFGNSELYIPNYTGSNKKIFLSDSVQESNVTNSYIGLVSGLWQGTNAITSITITPEVGSLFNENTTATLYGVGGARATGGTITADSTYTYHTFTSSGTFTALENIKGADYLVIAGGGGGGAVYGAGGGAGGYLTSGGIQGGNTSPGSSFSLNAGSSYSAIIGAGGAAGIQGTNNGSASNGSNSFFMSIMATGGGGGAGNGNADPQNAGGNGGSSGGGTYNVGAAGTPTSSPVQGYSGGSGPNSFFGGGGGGGAGGAGVGFGAPSGASDCVGGIGLNSLSSWATATNTGVNGYYAGGGGGYGATGGLGGGGVGGGAGTAGTANTGSGGGGSTINQTAGAGGSGIIIIRYPN